MAKSFSKSVAAWAKATPQRVAAVHARSVELLAENMQTTKPQGGRVPFQTGNLANSLLASTTGMPPTSDGPFTGSNVGLVAATLKANQAVWLGYQAKYARRRNNGMVGSDSLGRTVNETGDHFVEGAISDWPSIVRQAAREIRSQVK